MYNFDIYCECNTEGKEVLGATCRDFTLAKDVALGFAKGLAWKGHLIIVCLNLLGFPTTLKNTY